MTRRYRGTPSAITPNRVANAASQLAGHLRPKEATTGGPRGDRPEASLHRGAMRLYCELHCGPQAAADERHVMHRESGLSSRRGGVAHAKRVKHLGRRKARFASCATKASRLQLRRGAARLQLYHTAAHCLDFEGNHPGGPRSTEKRLNTTASLDPNQNPSTSEGALAHGRPRRMPRASKTLTPCPFCAHTSWTSYRAIVALPGNTRPAERMIPHSLHRRATPRPLTREQRGAGVAL